MLERMTNYFRRLYTQLMDGEIQLVAASLAYSTVLSLIPFIAVTLAILHRLGGLETLYPKVEKLILSNFSEAIGSEGIKLIRNSLSRIQSAKLGTLGAFVLILTSTRMIHVMEKGINRVWQIKNTRNIIHRLFFYWSFILIFPFGLATWVAFSTSKSVSEISSQVPNDIWEVVPLFISLYLIYKMAPNTSVRNVAALVGSLVGSVSVAVIHKVFLWSSHEVFNYGKFYGSLAAIPLFLLWLLVMWNGILLGAAVSAAFQQKGGRS